MARAVISDPKQRAAYEPLYDIDPTTGASVEVFYADHALASSFGRSTGWFWWTCQSGFLPDGLPTGPFAIATRWKRVETCRGPTTIAEARRTVIGVKAERVWSQTRFFELMRRRRTL